MLLSQNWVGYLDRSYQQIKRAVISRLSTEAPEITDHSESNPLIIIISFFSGIAEMLGLYIDRMAQEAFIGTAKKYTSVVRLSKLIDYQIKAKIPSSANLLISLVDNDGNLVTYSNGSIVIPANTVVSNGQGIFFKVVKTIAIKSGVSSAYAQISQYTDVFNQLIGTTDGSQNQRFELPDNYVHNSLTVKVNGTKYFPYNSIGLMNSDTRGFYVSIEEDGKAYLNFGDGYNGYIPNPTLQVIINYQLSEGAGGRLGPNTITTLDSEITLPEGISLSITNPDYASGGADFETINLIRDRAPRNLRTLRRGVTAQDYIDLALLVGGVSDAKIRYCCGKYFDLFISPNSKGSASIKLIEDVTFFLRDKTMVGLFPNVQASGISRIWIKGKIYGAALISLTEIQLQVADALDTTYGYGALKINRRVIASEIIALIEGLSKVDRFELEGLKIIPYVRAVNNTKNPLNLNFITNPLSTIRYNYEIVYNGVNFEVYRDKDLKQNIIIDELFSDAAIISFKVPSGTYTSGDKWQFIIFPTYPEIFPVTSINVNDYSAPVVEVADYVDDETERAIIGDIQIITQDIIVEELPTCE